MKKQIGMVGVILAMVAVQAAPFVGKAVGTAVEKAVARELAEEVAEAGVKAAATRTMSSALAGLTARKAMGIGVGVGAAAALPVAAHELSDGVQEEAKARAEVIRKIGEETAKILPERPELAVEVSREMNAVSGRAFGGGLETVWLLLYILTGGVGLVAFLYLGGVLIRAFRFARQSVEVKSVER